MGCVCVCVCVVSFYVWGRGGELLHAMIFEGARAQRKTVADDAQ